jgi:hypothetical protein
MPTNELKLDIIAARDTGDMLTNFPDYSLQEKTSRQTLRPVFIGGCGRSGTTLLGSMLGTHSHCLATPESKFNLTVFRNCIQDNGEVDAVAALGRIKEHWSFKIWGIDLDSTPVSEQNVWTSYSELMEWLVKKYGSKVGKAQPKIWVDHTPGNVTYAATLLRLFPQAKIIHLIRDGRAAASSVIKLDWGPNTVTKASRWWMEKVAYGLAAESFFGPERVKQVRYENLILEPEAILKEICAFLQLEYQPEMVNGSGFRVPQYTSRQHTLVGQKPNVERLQAWQKELPPRQIEIFESIAANFLSSLGYGLLYGPSPRRMAKWERVMQEVQELYRRELVNRVRRRRRIRQSISTTIHHK